MRPVTDQEGSPSSPVLVVRRRTSEPSAFAEYTSRSPPLRSDKKASRELFPPGPVGESSSLLHAASNASESGATSGSSVRRDLRTMPGISELRSCREQHRRVPPSGRPGHLSFHGTCRLSSLGRATTRQRSALSAG